MILMELPVPAAWYRARRAARTRHLFFSTSHAHTAERRAEEAAERAVSLAFASLHKRAFGVAVGTAAALALAALTLAGLAGDPAHHFPLGLLGQYLRGYAVSPLGVLVGAAWGFAIGFVAGWFIAFTRNLVLTVWLVVVRAKLHLAQGQHFFDNL